MAYKTFPKGSNTKLSTNFTTGDFDCHGSGCCKQTIVNEELVKLLQNIRTHFNAPVTVTSGYRCATHNKNVGGATGSRHTKGDAADIVVKGVAPRTVAQYAESIGIKGIGLYETQSDGYFVHIDTRDYKSFWYGQAQKSMTTFGTAATTTSSPVQSSDIMSYGDSGDAVKTLQEKLIKLGYACGKTGADGHFGAATRIAVRKFQTDHNLVVDGIVGYATKTAIEAAVAKTTDFSAGKVKVTATLLNVRNGAATTYPIVKVVAKGTELDIMEVKDGWGKLRNETGWVCLEYTEKA